LLSISLLLQENLALNLPFSAKIPFKKHLNQTDVFTSYAVNARMNATQGHLQKINIWLFFSRFVYDSHKFTNIISVMLRQASEMIVRGITD